MLAATSPIAVSETTTVSRRARRDTELGLAERVADEPYRLDQRRAERVELLAQVADVRLDDVRVAAEVVVPHVVEDLALRQDAPRVQHQEPEQLELGASQLDQRVAAPHFTCLLVERQVGEAHRALGIAAGP